MNLLNALAEAQGGQGLNNLAAQFGLSPQQTQSAVGALIPQIVSGMQGQSGGLGALVGLLTGGSHAAVAEQSGPAFGAQGVSMGNEVLGQIFGSKEVSRGVADQVSQQTGVGADVLRKMLPVVVTMVMGALAKQGMGGGAAAAPQAGGLGGMLGGLLGAASGNPPAASQQGGMAGMLSSVLDANKDGNVADDLMKLAGGFFSKR